MAYIRVSKEREEGISPEIQLAAITDYCRGRGYQLVETLTDLDLTGRFWRRRQVEAAVTMIEAGTVDVLVVWKVSRVARNRKDWAIAVDRIESIGGRLESATEQVDTTTSTGRLARGMLAELAAFESERIGEVWKDVHAHRISRGLPSRGGQRFGYDRDGDTYTPNADGPVLAGMYRAYIAGTGFTTIAARLNADGHRTRTGALWTSDGVARVLDSGFGAGLISRGTRRRATHTTGVHPAVITSDEWAAYLAARRVRAGLPPKVATPAYLLTGLIVCGDCGSPMWANRLGVAAGYGYVCSRWQRSRGCRCITITRAKAETAVLDWLRHVADDVDTAAHLQAQRVTATRSSDAAATRARQQLDTVRARLAKLTLGWTEGLVPDGAYTDARDELARRETELVARVERATADATVTRLPAQPVVRGLLDDWAVLPLEQKRAMLGHLITRVRVLRPVDGGRVTVEVVPR